MSQSLTHVLARLGHEVVGAIHNVTYLVVGTVRVKKASRQCPHEERSRGSESATFLRRALIFQAELQKKRFPNATSLAAMSRCSRSTAMRTIDKLRYELGVPLEYDESHRGYYLARKEFSLAALPPSKDELVALLILREFGAMIADAAFHGAVSALCLRMVSGRADVEREIEHIRAFFSFDAGFVARLEALDIFWLLKMCRRRQLVRLNYRSPSGDTGVTSYLGVFERIRLSFGSLHALFRTAEGHTVVLNSSFVVDVEEIGEVPHRYQTSSLTQCSDGEQLSGQGRWSGAPEEEVEIVISAPESRVFGVQIWHPEQHDSWDGDTLIRRFPASISRELARTLLSLGRSVVRVTPHEIMDRIRDDVANLARLCGSGG